MANINKAVEFMLEIANDDSHGYDQAHRNSPDYDCSSLVATALNVGGFKVSPNSWTGNLKKQLLDCGFKIIPLTEPRKKGDIFLSEKRHVVMCVDSDTIVHASINEKGTATGGEVGDQTGKEICTRKFYTPNYGWDYHFRYYGANDNTGSTVKLEQVKATNYAQSHKDILRGVYSVTADWLNVRNGGGTHHNILTQIPMGYNVRCYGYYTIHNKNIWLYVTFKRDGVEYTGFCSHIYLKKED